MPLRRNGQAAGVVRNVLAQERSRSSLQKAEEVKLRNKLPDLLRSTDKYLAAVRCGRLTEARRLLRETVSTSKAKVFYASLPDCGRTDE